MMEGIDLFLAPAVLGLFLVGIHCYLGLHVLERGIIFVDLSLAQLAACGYVSAIVVGLPQESWSAYFMALGMALAGSAFFSLTRKMESQLSQEAIIGITYAFASSLMVLLLTSHPHGDQHIKQMMIGRLLWVDWHEVIKVGVIYSLVGLIHYLFRHHFWKASRGKGHLSWDFLFYALFALVITSSVGTAGLLLVFSYLIVPPVISLFFSSRITARLFIGWGLGLGVSFLGMFLSFHFDYPLGATIVFLACSLAMVLAFGRTLRRIVMS